MPSLRELQDSLPRHTGLDALLSDAGDKHMRKTRRVEWIGDYNPMADERVLAKLLMGAFTPLQQQSIRKSTAFGKYPDGTTRRLMENGNRHAMATVSHLGRTYHFTASNGYVCDVDYRDVDVLLGDPHSGHEFVDLDDPESAERRKKLIVPTVQVFKLISRQFLDRDTDIVPRGFKAASHE